MCSGTEIKTGIVSVMKGGLFKPKAWVMKRCTLYNSTEKSAAILEIGDDMRGKDSNKKTYSLENIQSIQVAIFKSQSLQVMVNSKNFKLIFLVETEEEADSWVKNLKDVSVWEEEKKKKEKKKKRSTSPDTRSSVTDDSDFESCENSDIYESYEAMYYDIEMIKTEASTRCNLTGSYSLLLTKSGIQILSRNRQVVYYDWPYRYIRRYGKTGNSFTFEAGRKCKSGEGNFQFITVPGQGPDIFANVALLVSMLKPNQSEVSSPKTPDINKLCYKDELEKILSQQGNQNRISCSKINSRDHQSESHQGQPDENSPKFLPTVLNKTAAAKTNNYCNINNEENEYSRLEVEPLHNNDIEKQPTKTTGTTATTTTITSYNNKNNNGVIDDDNDDNDEDEDVYDTCVDGLKVDDPAEENEYECLNISTSQDKGIIMGIGGGGLEVGKEGRGEGYGTYDHLNFQNINDQVTEGREKFQTWDYETLNNITRTNTNTTTSLSSPPSASVCECEYSLPIVQPVRFSVPQSRTVMSALSAEITQKMQMAPMIVEKGEECLHKQL
ncbi:docking protein 6-like [Argonauta hians]